MWGLIFTISRLELATHTIYGPPEAVRVPLCGGIRGRVGQRCVAHQPQAQDPALPTLGIDQLEQGASAPMMEVLLHRDEGLPSPRAQRIVPSPRVRRPTPLVGHLCFDLLFSDEKRSSACNYGVWRRGGRRSCVLRCRWRCRHRPADPCQAQTPECHTLIVWSMGAC